MMSSVAVIDCFSRYETGSRAAIVAHAIVTGAWGPLSVCIIFSEDTIIYGPGSQQIPGASTISGFSYTHTRSGLHRSRSDAGIGTRKYQYRADNTESQRRCAGTRNCRRVVGIASAGPDPPLPNGETIPLTYHPVPDIA